MSGGFSLDPLANLAGPAPAPDERAELRRLSHELEGVFFRQLFAAMRSSLPEGGLVESTPGEETFRALLDESLAGLAAEKMDRGIGEALYRQLCRRLEQSEASGPPSEHSQSHSPDATTELQPGGGGTVPERGNGNVCED